MLTPFLRSRPRPLATLRRALTGCLATFSAVAAFTALAGHAAPAAASASSAVGAVPLTSGVAQPLAGRPDQKLFFTIDVPEGAGLLTLALAGSNGEADLYVSLPGQPVSFSHHDCISSGSGGNELCTFYNPVPGRYTALVYDGFRGFNNALLTATTQLGAHHGPEATPLAPAQPVLVSGRKAGELLYKVEVPAGTYRMTVATAGGSGDVDLAMRFEEMPDAAANGCSDFGGTSTLCDQGFPTAGTWYLKLTGAKAFSSVALTATLYQPAPLTLLANGATLTVPAGNCCEMQYYRIDVPEGAGKLTVHTAGDRDSDLALYVSHGTVPRWYEYDCGSDNFGATETCVIPTPQAGTYYIGLLSHFGFAAVPLTATYELGGGGYTGADCPPAAAQRTGTLYRGQTASFPFKSSGGRVRAQMIAPSPLTQDESFGMDFDLFLEQRVGQAWQVVASSSGTAQYQEQLVVKDAPAGTLRWTVSAFEGSGSFRLCAAK